MGLGSKPLGKGKYNNPKFQGTKTELISVLKNACFKGASSKS
jgi:hypothetical protein